MRSKCCKHCGRDTWDHIGIGGVLLCGTEFEPEDPTCFYCEEGWPKVKRDRRKSIQYVCGIDANIAHTKPGGTP